MRPSVSAQAAELF